MPLTLTQSATATAPGCRASFLGINGTSPYVYTVLPGGAGGAIDSNSGVYLAPPITSSDPKYLVDTVQVTDALAATATAQILTGTPLLLFCDIIQRELSLAPGRVYVWDQKIMQPTDSGLYVAVSVPRCKPFGNVNRSTSSGNGMGQDAFIAMLATVDIDIISRGPIARDRKEEVILALGSIYAQQQQSACSFSIGKLPTGGGFVNLSEIDGAAIPYRYRITVQMQYAYAKVKPAQFYDDFSEATVVTNE